jgi:bifunctional DNase/RNase
MKRVELAGIHIEASTGTPVVLLRERDAPHRVLPIFVGGPEVAAIALGLSGQSPSRPLTHDVMAALVESLDAAVERAEVTEVRDGASFAELAVIGPSGRRRVDTRPSDAIALALRVHAPLFVSDGVLDEAGAVLPEALEEEAIESELAEFRSFLAGIAPTDFDDALALDRWVQEPDAETREGDEPSSDASAPDGPDPEDASGGDHSI